MTAKEAKEAADAIINKENSFEGKIEKIYKRISNNLTNYRLEIDLNDSDYFGKKNEFYEEICERLNKNGYNVEIKKYLNHVDTLCITW